MATCQLGGLDVVLTRILPYRAIVMKVACGQIFNFNYFLITSGEQQMVDVILVLNSGSSSMKFSLYEIKGADSFEQMAKGQLEGIGSEPYFKAVDNSGKILVEKRWPKATESVSNVDRGPLLAEVNTWIDNFLGSSTLRAVGHRVLHGGEQYVRPVIVTDEVYKVLEEYIPFGPLHQPACLAPIEIFRKQRKDLPQIACFDTAFHSTIPEIARRYALPEEYNEKGIKKYGFHGLSYEYISSKLKEIAPSLAKGRVVVAHLGNGASLSAMREGQGIETTMGFTALDGLVMGTRCGAIDPGVLLYMMQSQNLNSTQIEDILYRKSGLLGVSGVSNDMRELRQYLEENPGSQSAQYALDMFSYRIVSEIGRMIAALEGIDGLVFTAGIGEHDAELRASVCKSLSWLGIKLDASANEVHADVISSAESKIEVRVIPTNEESVILHHVFNLIRG